MESCLREQQSSKSMHLSCIPPPKKKTKKPLQVEVIAITRMRQLSAGLLFCWETEPNWSVNFWFSRKPWGWGNYLGGDSYPNACKPFLVLNYLWHELVLLTEDLRWRTVAISVFSLCWGHPLWIQPEVNQLMDLQISYWLTVWRGRKILHTGC